MSAIIDRAAAADRLLGHAIRDLPLDGVQVAAIRRIYRAILCLDGSLKPEDWSMLEAIGYGRHPGGLDAAIAGCDHCARVRRIMAMMDEEAGDGGG